MSIVDAPIALEVFAPEPLVIEVFTAVHVPGPATSAQVIAASANAFATVAAYRVVRASGAGTVAHAHRGTRAHAGRILGLSVASAALGQPVAYVTHGPVDNPAWSLAPLQPVYCGDDGLVTQIKPYGDWSQQVGIALSPTRVLVHVQPPEFTDGRPRSVRVVCVEAVEAGDWLSLGMDGAITVARLARASVDGYQADAYSEVTAVAGQTIDAQLPGTVNRYATPDGAGRQFLAVAPGKCAAAPPADAGTVIQAVGKRVAGGVLFQPGEPILRETPA